MIYSKGNTANDDAPYIQKYIIHKKTNGDIVDVSKFIGIYITFFEVEVGGT